MYTAVFVAIFLLIAIALVHFYWATGGTRGLGVAIPTKNGKALFQPGKLGTMLVGVVMLGFAWIAYVLAFTEQPPMLVRLFGGAVSLVFIVRTIGDFHTVGLFKNVKDTPFARYDTIYYSPLTLFFSIVFGGLAYGL